MLQYECIKLTLFENLIYSKVCDTLTHATYALGKKNKMIKDTQLKELIKALILETVKELQAPQASAKAPQAKAPKASAKASQAPKVKKDTPYQIKYTQGGKIGQVKKITLDTLTKKLETYKATTRMTTLNVYELIKDIDNGKALDIAYTKTSFELSRITPKKTTRKATK